MKKIFFLNPLECKRSEEGAGARYQTKREVRSFRYPSRLARPAPMVRGSHAVDASPDGLTIDHFAPLACDYELAVLHANTPTLPCDERFAVRLRKMYSLTGGMLRAREVMGRRLRESVEFFRFLYAHKHTVRPSATVGGTGN